MKELLSGARRAKPPADATTVPAKRAGARSPVNTRPAGGRPAARAPIKRAAADRVHDAGLAASWPEFRATLRENRQHGYAVSMVEVDSGVFGIAALLDIARQLSRPAGKDE